MSKKTVETRWHVVSKDPAVKIRVKRYTTRDGMDKTKLERSLMARFSDSYTAGKDLSDTDIEELYLINNFPLLRFGIAEAEGVELPLTEDAFWALPEEVMLQTAEAIREVNVQYAIPFLELRRQLQAVSRLTQESTPSTTSDSETNAS